MTRTAERFGRRSDAIPDDTSAPDEIAWREYRRAAIRTAVAALPPPQRQALSLAFLEELTHEQVAVFLGLPLGTTKTRIRDGMRRLRGPLMALLATTLLVVAAGLVTVSVRSRHQQGDLQRNEDALQMVTSSDAVAIRLVAAPGIPEETHGTYRTRPGADIAVLTLSHVGPP